MLLEHALRGLVFRKCGEKSESVEHNPIFANKTAGRGRVKPGLVGQSWISPHLKKRLAEVCGKFWNLRAQRLFHEKKPQVEVLLLSGVVGMPRIYRILPDWALI